MHSVRKVHLNTLKARELRKNSTVEEKILWSYLRNRELFPFKFRRQFVLDPYIIDFYCDKLKLVIELDGSQHADDEKLEYDKKRTEFLERYGIKVVRFWNDEIHKNLEGVIEYLLNIVEERNKQPHLPGKPGVLSKFGEETSRII